MPGICVPSPDTFHFRLSIRSNMVRMVLLTFGWILLVVSGIPYPVTSDQASSSSRAATTTTTSSISTSSSTSLTDRGIPSITIGDDVHRRPVLLPLVGAGTWQYNDTIAYQSVCQAFSAGYTLVDTAFGYRNQRGVGTAIQDCWTSSRENLFVLTKIPGGLNASQVHAAHRQNLWELQLDYVDHLMTHFPSDWDMTVASKEARQEEWLALEEIYKSGEARSIGISHYCPQHIQDILEVATVLPAINQVEYHVGSQDVDNVRELCHTYGITFMSFSPLCGPCELERPEDSLIDGVLVSEIASHYEGVSPSQVALRYMVQQGIPVIPKSNTAAHIKSNADIFGFNLMEEDMATLAAANKPSAETGDCDVP